MRPTPSFIIACSLLLVTLSVNISMPLFRVYTQAAGLGNGQTALVLAAYIMGMLPCYIFLGGISDVVGRKKILILSVVFAFLATLFITIFHNVYALVAARVCQGIALGLSMGTGTAYLTEVLRGHAQPVSRAANMASFATSIGFSGGALATTVALLISFNLVPVSYYGLLAITFAGLLFMLRLPDLTPVGGKIIRLPYFPPGMLPVNMAIALCWACTGSIIAIIPSQLAKWQLTAYSGFCLVLINWTGAFIQPFIRKIPAVTSLLTGYCLLPAGFGLVVLGCHFGKLAIVLPGTALVGLAAYGFSFMSGMTLISNASGSQRARGIAGFMFAGYLGFGIPAIFLGFLADRFGIVNALFSFELLLIILCFSLFIIVNRKNKRLPLFFTHHQASANN